MRPLRTFLNIAAIAGVAASGMLCGSVAAQESGFFSGLRLSGASTTNTQWSASAPGLKLGQALEFTRPAEAANPLPIASTAFGGYQFESGFALGASLSTGTSANLFAPEQGGIGLRFDAARWSVAPPAQSANVDVVSAFNYRNWLSVYGKLGVTRSDTRAGEIGYLPGNPDRTALSYGVGVRFDVTRNVGLKLELSRGTRFGLGLRTHDEPDTLNFGIRWSF